MIALLAGPQDAPRFVQGLGLPYLGASLEAAGFEASVFDLYPPPLDAEDARSPDERLADRLAEASPRVVGITVHTPAWVERAHLAGAIRERLPEVLLVAGGHHATAAPVHLLRNSAFDVCALGEAEETVVELARLAEDAQGRVADQALRSVAGIVCRDGDEIVRTAVRRSMPEVDALPRQAHHLMGLADYGPHPHLGTRSTGLLTCRGCPVRCAFCLNPQGRRLRRRDPVAVVDEIERVVKEFGITGFNVYDNLFGFDRAHASALCREILRRKLEVVWDCSTAGALVDEGLATLMEAAGCVRVGFGAESGDDGVLAASHRGFTAEEHLAGLAVLHRTKMNAQVWLMIGLPGESRESVARTVEFVKRSGARSVLLSVFRPYPGTPIWRRPETFGCRLTRGPNFEAYLETEALTRREILECARQAGEELGRSGVAEAEFLRWDVYDWEEAAAESPPE